jgi:hypothetical protein
MSTFTFVKGHGTGRLEPPNFDHVERYPARRGGIIAASPGAAIERVLDLPKQYIEHYDQGQEGACVGFSLSWNMSILNRQRYDAFRIYKRAQDIDEWPGSDYSGTSVNAGCRVLLTEGHWRLQKSRWWAEARAFLRLEHGIAAYRWTTDVNEIRASIAAGIPVTLGINWYSNFDSPVYHNKEWWVGRGELGQIRGGHAITVYAASDKREAVRLTNTWGFDYPRVYMPYSTLDRVLRENGEAVLITDR